LLPTDTWSRVFQSGIGASYSNFSLIGMRWIAPA
jgi:hypothetical protein